MNEEELRHAKKASDLLDMAADHLRAAGLDLMEMKIRHHKDTVDRIRLMYLDKLAENEEEEDE